MGDVLAMAVFREHEIRNAQRNLPGPGIQGSLTVSPRERIAALLLAAAAWLSPAPHPAPLPNA